MRLLRLSPLLLLTLAAGCGMRHKMTAPLVDSATTARDAVAAQGARAAHDRDDDGEDASRPGAVYTLSNAASGNSVLAFPRPIGDGFFLKGFEIVT